MRRLLGSELVPEWGESMPRAAPARLPKTSREGAAALYFPACINRIFGLPAGDGATVTVPNAIVEVSRRAGLPVWIPDDVPGTCCGTPWSSKGFCEGHALMSNRIVESLWRWSDGGELPVVIDASSCTHGLVQEVPGVLSDENRDRHGKLELIDSVAWIGELLLPRLEDRRRLGSVAVHPTCSGRHLGLDRRLRALAAELADEAYLPPSASCCGFAGDRGFLHPELTEAATRPEAAEVTDRSFDAYISSNRTCEIGMERATGKPYVHAVQVLEQLTRPA